MLAQYINDCYSNSVHAFVVDKDYISYESMLDIPVVDFEEACVNYHVNEFSFINSLGYTSMNKLRKDVTDRIVKAGYEIESFIHPDAIIHSDNIGKGNIILDNSFIGYNSKLGDGNIIWSGTNISHEVDIGDYNYFSPSCAIAGNVNINNNCFFGINSSVVNDVSINDMTLVGAGCCIKNNTNKNDVYVPGESRKIDKNSLDIKIK